MRLISNLPRTSYLVSLGEHKASLAAMVDRVSPSCMKMELIRAISSADFPSAMQQAREEIKIANSQEFMTSPLWSI